MIDLDEYKRQALKTCPTCRRPTGFRVGDTGPDVDLGRCARHNGFECLAVAQALSDERDKIARWLRTTPRAGGVLIDIGSSGDVERLANAIEAGDYDDPKD